MAKLALGPADPAAAAHDRANDDAIAALVTLGYSEKDARDKLDKVRRGRDAGAAGDVEGLVKAVLQM
jgi:Holliday junction resolvasome RuvABC DNA-binding subunit